MILVDTSVWVNFFNGTQTKATPHLKNALFHSQVILSPVVLSELLSDSRLKKEARDFLLQLSLSELTTELWIKAGELRSKILDQKRKATLMDTLIAITCIENSFYLLTEDRDYRVFEGYGLKTLTL